MRPLPFRFALIANPHLHELGHVGYPFEYVVHDGGVTVVEALVAHAQVRVGVDVKDPEPRIPLRAGLDRACQAALSPAIAG